MAVSKKTYRFAGIFTYICSIFIYAVLPRRKIINCRRMRHEKNTLMPSLLTSASVFPLEEMELEITPHQKERLTHIDAALTVGL
jgi:hypothetical protein